MFLVFIVDAGGFSLRACMRVSGVVVLLGLCIVICLVMACCCVSVWELAFGVGVGVGIVVSVGLVLVLVLFGVVWCWCCCVVALGLCVHVCVVVISMCVFHCVVFCVCLCEYLYLCFSFLSFSRSFCYCGFRFPVYVEFVCVEVFVVVLCSRFRLVGFGVRCVGFDLVMCAWLCLVCYVCLVLLFSFCFDLIRCVGCDSLYGVCSFVVLMCDVGCCCVFLLFL